jgi:hypothetical protein
MRARSRAGVWCLGAWDLVGGAWSFGVSLPPCAHAVVEFFRPLSCLPCPGDGLIGAGVDTTFPLTLPHKPSHGEVKTKFCRSLVEQAGKEYFAGILLQCSRFHVPWAGQREGSFVLSPVSSLTAPSWYSLSHEL